jgi:hypothetical protein
MGRGTGKGGIVCGQFLVGCARATNRTLKVENRIRKSLDHLNLMAFRIPHACLRFVPRATSAIGEAQHVALLKPALGTYPRNLGESFRRSQTKHFTKKECYFLTLWSSEHKTRHAQLGLGTQRLANTVPLPCRLCSGASLIRTSSS